MEIEFSENTTFSLSSTCKMDQRAAVDISYMEFWKASVATNFHDNYLPFLGLQAC